MKLNKFLPWVILALAVVIFLRGASGYLSSISINGTDYNTYMKTDFPGGDLQGFDNLTRDDCAQKCQSTPGCIGFGRPARSAGYRTSCWLKKTWGPQTPNDRVNTYARA